MTPWEKEITCYKLQQNPQRCQNWKTHTHGPWHQSIRMVAYRKSDNKYNIRDGAKVIIIKLYKHQISKRKQ